MGNKSMLPVEYTIQPNLFYSGSHVLKLIEQDRQRLQNIVEMGLQAKDELDGLKHYIEMETRAITDIAVATRAGETLITYICTRRQHEKLSGALNSYEDLYKVYSKAGLVQTSGGDDSVQSFVTQVRQFLFAIDLIQKGKSNGSHLITWINSQGVDWVERLNVGLTQINRGGNKSGMKPWRRWLYQRIQTLITLAENPNRQYSEYLSDIRDELATFDKNRKKWIAKPGTTPEQQTALKKINANISRNASDFVGRLLKDGRNNSSLSG